jgi:hypothetical protein
MTALRRVGLTVVVIASILVPAACDILVAPTPFGAPADSATSDDETGGGTRTEQTDGAGVTISPTSIGATEGGADGSYEAVLTTMPAADVTVAMTVTNGEVTVAPASITFTTGTWDTAQTVTVSAVDDLDVEGNHSDTVTHAVTSADTDYDGILVADVSVSVVDNDGSSSTITIDNPAVPTFSIANGGVTLDRSVPDAWNLDAVAGPGVTITAFDWLVNGVSTSVTQLVTLNSTDPETNLGANTLTLFVQIDGAWYSDSFVFQVVEN